jgi:hypothetical protein
MTRIFSTALAGLVLGGILYAAHSYSPALLPWVTGGMLACLAVNLRTLTAA